MNDRIEQAKDNQAALNQLLRDYTELQALNEAERCLSYGADASSIDPAEPGSVCAFVHHLHSVCNTVPVNQSLPLFKSPSTHLIKQMITSGIDPNHPNLSAYGHPLALLARSGTMDPQHKVFLSKAMLDTGMNIPERELTDITERIRRKTMHSTSTESFILLQFSANLQVTREIALERFNAWQATGTPPTVTALSSRDLVFFANIDRFHELLYPDLWRGHEAHLKQLLNECPSWMSDAAAPMLSILEAPSATITRWSIESSPTAEIRR